MAVQRKTMPALALSISQRNAETMGVVSWWHSLEPRGVSVTQASAVTFVKQVGSTIQRLFLTSMFKAKKFHEIFKMIPSLIESSE